MLHYAFGFEWWSTANLLVTMFGTAIFIMLGLHELGEWVPAYKRQPEVVKEHIERAYAFFIVATVCLLFGIYFVVLAGTAFLLYTLYLVWKSIRIMFGKEK
ncbi:MAG: hypothetical protein NUV98_06820 [Candidatus Roizmanbacteria bacterium]|nr:hypothetical protein [Candidatus Roizmanbacteria bacterium]